MTLKAQEAATILRTKLDWQKQHPQPKTAIILGSGLGGFSDVLENKTVVSYADIPHLPPSQVSGHAGQFVMGTTKTQIPIIVMQGRIHYYEGHDLATVTLPIRVLKELGIKNIILTGACGSVNPSFKPGDLVLIDDHLNLMSHSPLHGFFDPKIGPQFLDLSEPYDSRVNNFVFEHCRNQFSMPIQRGVYAGVPGPNYETPAEIRMLSRLGADIVGMSIVHECIVAKQCGLRVNGVACVCNYGSGLGSHKLDHHDVELAAKSAAPHFANLLLEMITTIETQS